MRVTLTDKINNSLRKNVKILLIVIAALVVIIVLLLIFRPSKSIPNSVYQFKIDSLSQEIHLLEGMIKINEAAIKAKDDRIAAIEDRDSILRLQYNQKYDQLKNLKINYEKKRTDIDRYGSADIKRAFSELTDDE